MTHDKQLTDVMVMMGIIMLLSTMLIIILIEMITAMIIIIIIMMIIIIIIIIIMVRSYFKIKHNSKCRVVELPIVASFLSSLKIVSNSHNIA